jgi:hypothetical protein
MESSCVLERRVLGLSALARIICLCYHLSCDCNASDYVRKCQLACPLVSKARVHLISHVWISAQSSLTHQLT